MPVRSKWQSLPTEAINAFSLGIDKLAADDIVDLMLNEDRKMLEAVRRERERIAVGVEMIAAALRKGGRIVFNAGRSTIDCTVRNLSPRGAKLQVTSVIGIPDTFDLLLDGHARQPCRVAWRSLKELGVSFTPEH